MKLVAALRKRETLIKRDFLGRSVLNEGTLSFLVLIF